MEDVSTCLLLCLCPSDEGDESVTDDERHVTFAEYAEADDGTSKYWWI